MGEGSTLVAGDGTIYTLRNFGGPPRRHRLMTIARTESKDDRKRRLKAEKKQRQRELVKERIMFVDAFDINGAAIMSSPADIGSWPITVGLSDVTETPGGGFVLDFDPPPPDSWKASTNNPESPTDNFQYTVWMFVQQAGALMGAGFVQMWQGREMGKGALPSMFAPDPNTGALGFTNWWGDARNLWGPMSGYVPKPGDTIGIMVSAGNARLVAGVTSVRERSNVVAFKVAANDTIAVTGSVGAPGGGGNPPPVVIPPAPPASGNTLDSVTSQLETLEGLEKQQSDDLRAAFQTIAAGITTVSNQVAALTPGAPGVAPIYDGSLTIPFIGTVKITLTPRAK